MFKMSSILGRCGFAGRVPSGVEMLLQWLQSMMYLVL